MFNGSYFSCPVYDEETNPRGFDSICMFTSFSIQVSPRIFIAGYENMNKYQRPFGSRLLQ